MSLVNKKWLREFDVYDRIEKLGLDLGTKDEALPPSKGAKICKLTFTPSGLVFTSGVAAGDGAVTDDDAMVADGNSSGRDAAVRHLKALHWALDPFGSLNDVWYCVKAIGMVSSAGGGVLTRSPEVVDGYSKLFHDVFGGALSEFATDGTDTSLSGWHARSAVGGYDLPGGAAIEPEMIFQIDPKLAKKIIRKRGPHCGRRKPDRPSLMGASGCLPAWASQCAVRAQGALWGGSRHFPKGFYRLIDRGRFGFYHAKSAGKIVVEGVRMVKRAGAEKNGMLRQFPGTLDGTSEKNASESLAYKLRDKPDARDLHVPVGLFLELKIARRRSPHIRDPGFKLIAIRVIVPLIPAPV